MMESNSETKIDLLGFCLEQMQQFFIKIDEQPFRAVQLIKWLHQQRELDFNAMTNISKNIRAKLGQHTKIDIPEVIADQTATDGTRKWLFKLPDNNSIETVFIPTESRGTLCISSQVGCSLNCSFCYTAQQGYNRNLSASEIIVQLWLANKILQEDSGKKITNVVIMGMGEPLLNFDNMISALKLMLDDNAYGLSKKRVTLSTSGVVPRMYDLVKEVDVSLAVSLHAPTDELRDQIVPINKKYPIKELMQACKDYASAQNKKFKITFEYIMLKNVNDQLHHAKKLINVIQGVPCKVNLIPFNPFNGSDYQTSTIEDINKFQQKLTSAGINTIVRRTRGEDIDAACGQLAGKIKDRTKRSKKFAIRQSKN